MIFSVRNLSPVVHSYWVAVSIGKGGRSSMFSIRSSILGVCELKASTCSVWARFKGGNSDDLLRPKSFDWGRVNHWHHHSVTSPYNTGATGSSSEPSESSNFPLDWDPFEDFFGLGVDLRSRKDTPKQQPKQKYELEMPCPTCEGRGYLFCPHCRLRKSDNICPHCSGKGYHDCPLCHGNRVFLEDILNDSTWAGLHSRSPLQTAEDDAIENMAISSAPKRKTRRLYGPRSPETREKIKRALKELEARTGSISRRMRKIHKNPVLHAQRTAAIKKARGTDEARRLTSERLKEYFQSPENRLKHSKSMTGVRFTCKACGEEGHRRHFCPKLELKSKKTDSTRSYRCSSCGKLGHGRRQCPDRDKLDSTTLVATGSDEKKVRQGRIRVYRCKLCHKLGHTRRTCATIKAARRLCSICGQSGHNKRTCSVVAAK